MKIYRVNISSYEVDNPYATYDRSTDYPTFEEAQKALEKKFWLYAEGHNVLSARDFEFDTKLKTFSEIPDSDYLYKVKATNSSFNICGEWSDFDGEIEEITFVNVLPYGHWFYINKHGLPKVNGLYLCSIIPEKWEIDKGIKTKKYTDILWFENGLFYKDEDGSNPNVYAWTEIIAPARL